MSKIDRSILSANNQNMGDFGDPDKLEASIKHVADVVDQNDTDATALKGDNTTNKNRLTALETDVTALETDNTSNKNRIGTLETDNTNNKNRISTLETDNTNNKSRLTTTESQIGSNESRLNNLLQNTQQASEVVDARRKADGTTFDILGDRLNDVDASLADKVTWVSVKEFDAIGDGVTDDTEAIQSAINFAGEKGGTVFFPMGVYIISNQITPLSGITLAGEDATLSTIKRGDYLANVNDTENCNIYCHDVIDFSIKNLTLDANGDNQSGDIIRTSCLIMVGSCDDWIIDNVNFKNARGTYVDEVVTGGYGLVCWDISKNIRVSNCSFYNIGQSDLGLFGGENWVVSNIISRDNGYIPINIESGASDNIRNIVVNGWTSFGANHSLISVIRGGGVNCDVSDVVVSNVVGYDVCKLGGSVGGIIIQGTNRTSISNVRINGCGSYGVQVRTTSNGYPVVGLNMSDVQIDGITANMYGFFLNGNTTNKIVDVTLSNIKLASPPNIGLYASYCEGLIINSSTVNNAGGSRGIYLTNCLRTTVNVCNLRGNNTYGICVDKSKYVNLIGNIISNSTARGIQIQSDSDFVNVISNMCYDDQTTKTQLMGIMVETTTIAPNIIIANNNVKGNGSNGIRWSVTNLSNMAISNNIDDSTATTYGMHQKMLLSNGVSSWKVGIDGTGTLTTSVI